MKSRNLPTDPNRRGPNKGTDTDIRPELATMETRNFRTVDGHFFRMKKHLVL